MVLIGENELDVPVALRQTGDCREVIAVPSFKGKVEGPELKQGLIRIAPPKAVIPKTRGTRDAYLPKNALRGRKYIFVDDWGPYDFSKVRLFPDQAAAWGTAEFYLLGPEGEFQVKDVTGGVKVAPASARLPATITVSADGGALREFRFTVEAGKERVGAKGILLSADWNVSFFTWENQGPQKPPKGWESFIKGVPIEERKLDRIDFRWGGGKPSEKIAGSFFGLVATTSMDLPAGLYVFRTVSDDGVRLLVDGKMITDNWSWHGPTEDQSRIQLDSGKHEIRIEYFQIDGFSQLQFWLEPAN